MRMEVSKPLFMASLCLAFFGYGVGTVHFRVFPFTILQNAQRAWTALREVHGEDDNAQFGVKDPNGLSAPSVQRFSAAAGDELLLIAGGDTFVMEHDPARLCLAWIADRQGKTKHVWHFDPAIWDDLEQVAVPPGKTPKIYPFGLHLYPDGGLLVSFQGYNTFPFAIGLARFDRDSNLLWKRELLNHHWFSVAPDGRIYAPALRPVDSPVAIGDTRFSVSSPDGKVLQDVVMILDADGNVLDEIPVLDALIKSGWMGLLQTQAGMTGQKPDDEHFVLATSDPTHLNAVEVVDARLAAAHHWLAEGDLLVSMRHTNAIGILDPRTRRFKWMSAGATVQQHSPRFHDGGILVLDNRGGPAASGGSQLVIIDLETQLPQVVFPRPSVSLPGEFYTSTCGHLDLARSSGGDSGRVLVTLHGGRKLWEISLASGEVLWEYVCVDPHEHLRRQLSTAKYIRDVSFPFNKQSEEIP
jgi:hypothetical protein